MNVTRIDNIRTRDPRTLLYILLAGGGLFLLWRLGRAVGSVFWALFGLAMAAYWSGAWRLMLA